MILNTLPFAPDTGEANERGKSPTGMGQFTRLRFPLALPSEPAESGEVSSTGGVGKITDSSVESGMGFA